MVLDPAVNRGADCLTTFHLRHLAAAAGVLGIRTSLPGAVWRECKEHRSTSPPAITFGRGQAGQWNRKASL